MLYLASNKSKYSAPKSPPLTSCQQATNPGRRYSEDSGDEWLPPIDCEDCDDSDESVNNTKRMSMNVGNIV